MPTPKSRVSSRSRWTLPVALALVCGALAVAAAVDPRWHAALDWRRDGLAAGQWWRLVSGHLMHLSATHATLDIAALLLVAWIFGDDLTTTAQRAALAAGIAAIDVGLWFFERDVGRYVGLSGVLHAWFAAGAVAWSLARDARATPGHRGVVVGKRVWGATLLVGLAAKLYVESRRDTFWLDDATLPVVTAAHRWGAAAGLVVATGIAVAGRLGRPVVRRADADAGRDVSRDADAAASSRRR